MTGDGPHLGPRRRALAWRIAASAVIDGVWDAPLPDGTPARQDDAILRYVLLVIVPELRAMARRRT